MSDKQKKQVPKLGTCMNTGDPGGIRTPDPRLRRPLLYPTGLLDHIGFQRGLPQNCCHICCHIILFRRTLNATITVILRLLPKNYTMILLICQVVFVLLIHNKKGLSIVIVDSSFILLCFFRFSFFVKNTV